MTPTGLLSGVCELPPCADAPMLMAGYARRAIIAVVGARLDTKLNFALCDLIFSGVFEPRLTLAIVEFELAWAPPPNRRMRFLDRLGRHPDVLEVE